MALEGGNDCAGTEGLETEARGKGLCLKQVRGMQEATG